MQEAFDKYLKHLYGDNQEMLVNQKNRYTQLDQEFIRRFDDQIRIFFSTPGRTEIGGNHTDHNQGRVLAASIDLDSIAAITKTSTNKVEFYSEGYFLPFQVDLDELEVDVKEQGTTTALIRGIAARFLELGYKIGGFSGCMTSNVLPGSGLSSSASIEVLIGSIFNVLFNDESIEPEIIAQIGQYAENVYFGKPCGLMDQMACAVGGVISIDFQDSTRPEVKKIDFDFNKKKYGIVIVDTGGEHSDLTDDYAAIPEEMKAVAKYFKKASLREVDEQQFYAQIKELRKRVGDRAVLRANHFFQENERVLHQINSLESDNMDQFMEQVKASGNSSFRWLQNIYSSRNVKEQGIALSLALSEKYLYEINGGACRVHGGGFAGTTQTFLPIQAVSEYSGLMQNVFGSDSVIDLRIRPHGTVHFKPMSPNKVT